MSGPDSPWLCARDAAAYIHRSRRYLSREVAAGRLRAAIVGGKRERLYRREWLDQHLEDLARPIEVMRRRIG